MTGVDFTPFAADAAHVLLALDFDGTLARIVENPEEAAAHPEILGVLARLDTEVACIAIITGRPARVAASRSGLASIAVTRTARGGIVRRNHLVVLGHYGAERWDGSEMRVVAMPTHPGIAEARTTIRGWLEDGTLPEDVTLEDKGRSVAVHTRPADEPGPVADEVERILAPLAHRLGLAVEPGRFVVELRPPGVDKGVALHELIEQVEPTGVIYVGDDLGDLPAFDEVAAFRKTGGAGLAICSGSDEVTELTEHADLVLRGPSGVASWLRDLAIALRNGVD